jgi:hypothetical protein
MMLSTASVTALRFFASDVVVKGIHRLPGNHLPVTVEIEDIHGKRYTAMLQALLERCGHSRANPSFRADLRKVAGNPERSLSSLR